jgi:alpha-amylase
MVCETRVNSRWRWALAGIAILLSARIFCWACADARSAKPERKWNHDIIYFVMTDRFLDGDPSNNVPEGSDPALYDESQTDVNKYHGGDLRGLELGLKDGYFNDLGVTAIWITPPVRNAWYSRFDQGGAKTGYHGYWAQDFLDIDPHLVSKTNLSGDAYPEGREGRMQHYRDFINLAHQRNIKVIQDVVCNHVGPLFYYDANGDGKFNKCDEHEWIAPYKETGFYDDAKWADVPKWNLEETEPVGPQTILGDLVKTTNIFGDLKAYGRKGFDPCDLGSTDGKELTCDFYGCRDFWTAPNSPDFDRLVDQFVEIYSFYVKTVGVDGLRVDTVRHVHRDFWDAFTERLRERLGQDASKLIMFGEAYDWDAQGFGRFTYRQDYPTHKEPCFDSMLNFEFCCAVRKYLRVSGAAYGSPEMMEKMIGDMESTSLNPTGGLDGLNARQKMVDFIDNHDGLNRFLVRDASEDNNRLALGLALTMQGIPCIYYGSEVPLRDAKGAIGQEGETGRLTLAGHEKAEVLCANRKTDTFRAVAALAKLRTTLPALAEGDINCLWRDSQDSPEDDGVFAFARYTMSGEQVDTGQTVVVVVNANLEKKAYTGYADNSMKLVTRGGQPAVCQGEELVQVYGADSPDRSFEVHWGSSGLPEARLAVTPKSINIFVTRRANTSHKN